MSIATRLSLRSTSLFRSLSLSLNLLTSFPLLLPFPPFKKKTKKTANDHLDRHAPPRALQTRCNDRGLPRKARGPARRAAALFLSLFGSWLFFGFAAAAAAAFAPAPPPALSRPDLGRTQAPPLRRPLLALFLPVLWLPGIERRRRLRGSPRRRRRLGARAAPVGPPLRPLCGARRRRQGRDGAGRRARRGAVLPDTGRAVLGLDRGADAGGGEGGEGGRSRGVEQDVGVGAGE